MEKKQIDWSSIGLVISRPKRDMFQITKMESGMMDA